MAVRIILASQSPIRRDLLTRAGIPHEVQPARVDEDAVKSALLAEEAPPRDIADALAELKAQKISERIPDALVIGCDQVLAFDGDILSKPASPEEARTQLGRMRGKAHRLISAAVICEGGRPIWRHVGVVQMQMRDVSNDYLDDYIARNWDSIRHSVGAYKLEEEGVRLFQRITGDHFHVLGLPLLELISFLAIRGEIKA
ncbi:septum formation protein [Roseovarius nanhaiticus]|uniref:Nucleoside triphosphate pyrophosphatase n=1 Tax=Roseovarius nanhaiticus TaxID=573024 RepID=A0A1N7EH75_9RHOB|nr:nucleoside triphosphate pyrophosphatase [Roseovarius nanhaiticus]SEK74664.1 septum formation protein [Roseovarius nanhaiticus]SIR87441.1 septum formation protein [Roseovarius nanhaiticus]